MVETGVDDGPTPEFQSLSSTGRMLSPLGSPIRDARSAHPRFIYLLRSHCVNSGTPTLQEQAETKGIGGASQTTSNAERKKDLAMKRRTDLVI